MLQRRRTALSSALLLAGAAAIAACSAGHSSTSVSAPTTTGNVDTTGFAVPAWATSAAFVGAIDGATPLKLQVHMRMQNEDAAIAQLADITDPDSANYGNFLSDDEFNTLYAPTAADFATVQAHLTGAGLTVTESPVNRAYIAVSGTAAQVGAAFGTKIGQFNVNGTLKRAPMTAATLPANVMPLVKGVLGLAQPMIMKPMIKRVATPDHTPPGSGGGAVTANTCTTYYGQITDSVDPAYPGGPDPLSYIGCGYVPSQVRAAYGLDTPVAQGNDGTGQTVAILDAFQSPTLLADAQQYFKNNDPTHELKSSQFTAYTGPGTPPPASCEETQDAQGWYGEQSLDVEAVHAVAPGAKIAFIGAVSDSDQDLISAINMVVTQHLASVVSNSWAGVEEGGGDFATFESTAIQAGLKGVGLYFASGDDGDWVQSLTSYGVQGATPSVSFPSSLTEVTAVGGTSLELNESGGRAFETGWETGNSYVVPAGFTTSWPPSGGGGGGGGGGCGDDDGGAGDDDAGQARTPFFQPMVIKDGGTDSGAADSGAAAANVWWPSAPGGFSGGAGGGTSGIYLQPKWQKGIVPNALATFDPNLTGPGAAARVVPDVGMLADPYTGYMIGMTDPVAGTYGEFPIGGTSLATPLFTASMALAQQYAGRHFGAANAVIYKASKSGALRDITPAASLQAVALPTYGFLATFSYTGPENILTAAPGFDDETGLGAPNGTKFLEALKQH